MASAFDCGKVDDRASALQCGGVTVLDWSKPMLASISAEATGGGRDLSLHQAKHRGYDASFDALLTRHLV